MLVFIKIQSGSDNQAADVTVFFFIYKCIYLNKSRVILYDFMQQVDSVFATGVKR